ncbi:eceriferum 26-like protein [Tanacetum coccineum]
MGLSKEESPIYDVKISTVGPGYVSGQGVVQELNGMDLAMKLHYIRNVYYFRRPALEGLTIINIKETMFYWLNHAYIPCGRFRKSDSGRPSIKCNDCGVRLIEAKCKMSLDEWLQSKDDEGHKLLVPNQFLGPDLPYSPLVLMQVAIIEERDRARVKSRCVCFVCMSLWDEGLRSVGMIKSLPGMKALEINTVEDAIVKLTREIVLGMILIRMEVAEIDGSPRRPINPTSIFGPTFGDDNVYCCYSDILLLLKYNDHEAKYQMDGQVLKGCFAEEENRKKPTDMRTRERRFWQLLPSL